MLSRQGSQDSFTSCHSSPSSNQQTRRGNNRQSIEDANVLAVLNLKGQGRVIVLRDLFYVFNLNARTDDDDIDKIDYVVDIRFLDDCALVKMSTQEAACRAKSSLNESWFFDKFITIVWATSAQCQLFNSNRPPLERIFRRRHDMARRHPRRPNATNPYRGGEDVGDVDDIQAQLAYYATNLPSKRTRFLRFGTGLNELQNLRFFYNFFKIYPVFSYVRHYASNNKSNQIKNEGTGASCSRTKQLSPTKRFLNPECTRSVTRDRLPPSPVLEVEGLEYSGDLGNNILARTDLITLFTFCGVVKDIHVGFCFQDNIVEKCFGHCKHRALVQMETIEQATRAINEFDHSWQMGRFIMVTYAFEQCIEHYRNINPMDRYSHKRL